MGIQLEPLAERLRRMLSNADLVEAIVRGVREHAPDERQALAFLLQLGELSSALLEQALGDPAGTEDLIFCLGGSELIAGGLVAAGPAWVEVFERARAASEGESSKPNFASVEALGSFKRGELLRIAIRDLLRRATVVETISAMSQLADTCIRGAIQLAARDFAGEDLARDFIVLAMGKLGAEELNLSSDVDLIYLFDSEEPARLARAQRFGERVTELIASHCFRIDLRLRPGGRGSPLVSSIGGALSFYESFGQTWERAALLRARPIFDPAGKGRRVLRELARFIYRSYLDFDTLRELRAIKQQIEHELRAPEQIQRNIKLGYGGIRELEFVVQALTLIYGGRDPRLRSAHTLVALERLGRLGYLASEVVHRLQEAYLHLRNVEHKLQIAAGLQTHSLPKEPAGVGVLAVRLGYGKSLDGLRCFERDLQATRNLVAEQFREMFQRSRRDEDAASLVAQEAWGRAFEPRSASSSLARLGFADPEASARELEFLVRGRSYAPMDERRRAGMERLGPRLLDDISQLPDPDLALRNFASFIIAVGARSSFIALLEQHPATRQVLLRLFASSAYLATLFIQHPEMIDTLVRSDLVRIHRARAELSQELKAMLDAAEDFEGRLNAIRLFRHQEYLRIAIADLAGEIELEAVQTELARLAEALLEAALQQARKEVAGRMIVPADLRLSIIAMGRLGAGQMTYNSDLDLIFVYHLPNELAGGGRVVAARIVQTLISLLESPTREGYAYKLDLRLRPSGNAGPLVATLESFREYHRVSSALWERQALVRARVIAGDAWLTGEIEQARREFVFGRSLKPHEVDEIWAMRLRIERELGQETPRGLNLKHGRGGILDLDFLAQMMALRYGHEKPQLRSRDTLSLMRGIAETGIMPEAVIGNLIEDYRFLTNLENRLRIESDHAASALPTLAGALTPIARRAGYDGPEPARQLLEDLTERRRRVRETVEDRFIVEAAR